MSRNQREGRYMGRCTEEWRKHKVYGWVRVHLFMRHKRSLKFDTMWLCNYSKYGKPFMR